MVAKKPLMLMVLSRWVYGSTGLQVYKSTGVRVYGSSGVHTCMENTVAKKPLMGLSRYLKPINP
jgi:hypothetical protein